ncbi:hypothetical protein QBC44DRAFT_103535 [Cladorrhinum sp. PSN332]|nr:hypothetical protein QBC44DRAFT_103535 [Cladorrhinum sp. PSN332]
MPQIYLIPSKPKSKPKSKSKSKSKFKFKCKLYKPEPKSSSPKQPYKFTCIVNTYPSHSSCDNPINPPIYQPNQGGPPICLDHLCQHSYPHHSNKRCLSRPLRIVRGFTMDGYGLYPDPAGSWNCARHEKYNCEAEGIAGERCSGQKMPGGWKWCKVHVGMLCRTRDRDRKKGGWWWWWCGGFGSEGSKFCYWHRW